MKFRVNLFYLILFFLFCNRIIAEADWTMLIYVQAKNNLSKFAAKNLSDMASIGSGKNLNILVQLYQPDNKGAWRYKIEHNKIELDTYLSHETDGSNKNDLVDSMRWAVRKYPAKNYFLVLWNHGVGIIDPVWGGKNSLAMNSKIVDENPRIQIDQITTTTDNNLLSNNLIPEDYQFEQQDHRGILFNEINKTYMTNKELTEALREIKTDVLQNRKLDILGMDACLMAMVEVGYQIKDSVNLMIASEEVELAHGWDYLNVLNILKSGGLSPAQVAHVIVDTYEMFYKNKIQFYTQSAVSLENIDLVKENLDIVINNIAKCKSFDNSTIKNILKNSRQSATQFSAKNYIDLHSFYYQLYSKISEDFSEKIKNKKISGDFIKSLEDLKVNLDLGMKLIESSVIACTVGKNLAKARGLSIYFPMAGLDSSYVKTDFAKNSKWVNFLKEIYV